MGYPLDLLKSRAVVRPNFALLDGTGLVPSVLPDFPDCTVYVLASPGLGANFAAYLLEVPTGRGTLRPLVEPGVQRFVYGLTGEGKVVAGNSGILLRAGAFAYVPAGEPFALVNDGAEPCRLLMVRRPYTPYGTLRPWTVTGHVNDLPRPAFQGMPSVTLQHLLPLEPAFDLMVNLFTFQPGDSLNVVETHHESHGAYILAGQGMYYLGDTWYPVKAGDFIWMGPYVPQAFYATGQEPASYLYTKDAHRDISFEEPASAVRLAPNGRG